MQVNPYLNFDGQCQAAFEYYAKSLGGKITMLMTFGESPMADTIPPAWGKKVLHATLSLGGQTLGGSDVPEGRYQKPQGFAVTLQIDTIVEADRVFKALSENGSVQMPLQETFWAQRFGMLVDRFGTPWMINCGRGTNSAE
jgi:PhnB protein